MYTWTWTWTYNYMLFSQQVMSYACSVSKLLLAEYQLAWFLADWACHIEMNWLHLFIKKHNFCKSTPKYQRYLGVALTRCFRRRKGRETPAKYDSCYKFTPHSRSQMQVYTFQESDSSIHTFFCKHFGVHMRFQNYGCWGSERSPWCFQKNNTVYNCSQSIQFNQLIHPNLSSCLLISVLLVIL